MWEGILQYFVNGSIILLNAKTFKTDQELLDLRFPIIFILPFLLALNDMGNLHSDLLIH